MIKRISTKKSWAILIMVFMLLQMMPVAVFAEGAGGGSVVLEPPSGTGTEADPYLIATPGNLVWMSENNQVRGEFAGKYFRQTNDIDMNGVENFQSIGVYHINTGQRHTFKGIYDGNLYKIYNLTMANNDNDLIGFGFFGYIGYGGVVKNLTIEAVITANGARDFSRNGILAGLNEGKLLNCKTLGSITTNKHNVSTGGIVGTNSYGLIRNSTNEATVTAISNAGSGGIASSNSGTIKDCINKGTISGATSGGIAGYTENYSRTINNINVGNVSSASWAGGITGLIRSTAYDPVNNYYLDNIAHGIGSVRDSSQNHLGPGNTGCNQKTETELKQQSTFVGFDFINTWSIDEGMDYPAPLPILPALELSVSVAPGTANFTTKIDLNDTLDSGNYLVIKKSSSPVNRPDITDPIVEVFGRENYTAGNNIFGVDAVNIRYIGVYDVNSLGDIERFTLVTLSAEDIKQPIMYGVVPSGSGTEEDPYLIAEAGNLAWMGERSYWNNETFAGEFFRQTADIDMSGISNVYPIGKCWGYGFQGTFDGNNHKIINLTMESSDYYYVALFEFIDGGTVKNLELRDISITNTSSTGYGAAGIVGYLSNGIISNCMITGNGVISSHCEVAGIVAEFDGGVIEQCSNSAEISVAGANPWSWYAVGGIVGGYWGGNVIDCYNTGTITGHEGSGASTGGIAGEVWAGSENFIANCYNTGTISEGTYIGGIVGYLGEVILENNFFLETSAEEGYGINETEVDYSEHAVAKTSLELKNQVTFTGWDFTDIWAIVDTGTHFSYPYLKADERIVANNTLAPGYSARDGGTIPDVTAPTYTVTYNGNGNTGGSVPIDESEYEQGDTVTVVGNTGNLVKTGYNFAGWNTAANGSGANYSGGATFIMGATGVTLYAKWTASSGGSSIPAPTPSTGGEATVIVNGKTQPDVADYKTETNPSGQTTATVTINQAKLKTTLDSLPISTGTDRPKIQLSVVKDADVVRTQLNGQIVKDMENKAVILEIKTPKAIYNLPVEEINIDAVSKSVGTDAKLSDIKVQIDIVKPSDARLRVVESSSEKGNFTLVVPPIEFNIICTFGNKNLTVNEFNSYVERNVVIPDNVNTQKITTGIVVEADGTVRHVPTKIIRIDGKYYAKINSLTNSTYSVIWNPKEFKDVDKHWAKEAVNDMGSRLVVSGVGNDMFEPGRDITRAEFAAIVVRTLGLKPESGNGTFTDVKNTDWYCAYIETAYKYGIISGYGNGKFGPNDKITREQAMTMVAKAMNLTGLKVDLANSEVEKTIATFVDAVNAADYAKAGIAACVKTGIVSGKGGNMVAPKDNITRAEVAVIVRNLLRKSDLI